MYKIKILPSGQEIDIEPETTLLEAFKRENIYIKCTCGGYASCGACKVKIVEGKENLSKAEFAELQLLGNVFHITKERLSCQTMVTGDVTVDISAHDKDRIENNIVMKKPKPPKVAKPLVRKKDEVERVKEACFQEYQAQKQEQERWKNHWEKGEDEAGVPRPKKLGGGRKPRHFDYRNDEVDFEKIKAENKARYEAEVDFIDDPRDEIPQAELPQTNNDSENRDFRKKREE